MFRPNLPQLVLSAIGLLIISFLAYQLPPINNRLSWRVDFALTYLRGVVNPVEAVPTPLPLPQLRITRQPSPTPEVAVTAAQDAGEAGEGTARVTPSPSPSPLPTLTPTPIPASVSLTPPAYEKQDINNCGPATLAMYLRYYGWEGDQYDIASKLKPQREDRNVNIEELTYYARTNAGWLNVEYRVGGTLELLKQLLAAGFPVVIEESFFFEESYWPNDDHWAAHYNLLTGYDDATQTFTVQDSFYGADRTMSYEQVDEYWQSFNRVYFLVYPPDREPVIKEILGPDWDPDANRQRALEAAQAEIDQDPENAFAWFNLGTNLLYFERYQEAAQAYDQARQIGLPQRMLRYQFGPFLAYFHAGRTEDLLALSEYALQRTPNAEEALLWRGWALFRQGDVNGAAASFQKALVENPTYQDARYALDFLASQ